MRTETLSRAASLAVLAAAAVMVTACESAGDPAPPTAASGAAKPGAPEVARIGAAGSACDMPVTFGLAASWKPKAVTITPDDPLADLARKGPLTMVCEIDAKPSGAIGFLRVWTGDKAELRSTLQAFIGTGAREPAFTDLRINDRPAVEVVYQEKSQADDELEQERAFAVETTSGVAAVSLDSFDSEEHKAMLPAYELAKASLTVTR